MADEEKEITMLSMAKMLNISTATISRALRNDPRISKKMSKRVHDLAHSVGYQHNPFASNLRRQRSHTIGVIIPRIDSHFMSVVISGMEAVARRAGFDLVISQSSESVQNEASHVLNMFNNRVAGVLVSTACDATNDSHFDQLAKKKLPVVCFDRVIGTQPFMKITIDNCAAAREATAHLISQGCRRIVHITVNSGINVYADRLKGYKEALSAADIHFDKQLIIYNDLSYDAGKIAAEMIRQMNPLPDGIFVANDICAVSCMSALRDAGIRIPQDIAFVGFNNDLISKVVEPNLTTVDYPGRQMGEIAMQHMVNSLDNRSETILLHSIVLRSELIVRDSSLKQKRDLIISPDGMLKEKYLV